jgi:hypothetical protein
MISDTNIYRAANVVIEQYGEDAQIHAAMRADAMREAGDPDGSAMWKRILRVSPVLRGLEDRWNETVQD